MENEAVDFRLEIRILQFWRGVLGEADFARYAQSDLVRWFIALDLAGPEEIREKLIERHGVRPMKELLGVVPVAPHPPVTLIETWLETHENKVHTAPVWLSLAGLLVACFTFGLLFSTCSINYNPNPLALNPQPVQPALNGPVFSGPAPIGGLTQVTPMAPGLPLPASPSRGVPNPISPPPGAGVPAASSGSGTAIANPGGVSATVTGH